MSAAAWGARSEAPIRAMFRGFSNAVRASGLGAESMVVLYESTASFDFATLRTNGDWPVCASPPPVRPERSEAKSKDALAIDRSLVGVNYRSFALPRRARRA